ncbi:hypothetical protein AL503_002150 [Staphylococcus haemolyticus]|uniref:Uncharacterized protein n=1 Tax=Staphylococcus haemolyticus TaxID=1283 RepID=A0A2K0AX43_STAHA|nr:hypothetical protein AL503_002150 [Staphylococcus haemolyticus]
MWKTILKIIVILASIYMIYVSGKTIYKVTLNLIDYFQKRFGDTYIVGPIGLYIVSVIFVFFITTIVVFVFIDAQIEVVKITITIFTVYTLFIGPLLMLALMILLNVPLEQLTIAFAVMSFIGVSFKKGKDFVIYIYNKLNDVM